MKNRTKLLVVAMFVSVGFIAGSCNSDDNNGGETIAPLVGKWKISKVGTTIAGTETLIDAPQNASGCEKDYINLKP